MSTEDFPVVPVPPNCAGLRWSVITYPGEGAFIAVNYLSAGGTVLLTTSFKIDPVNEVESRAWVVNILVHQTADIIRRHSRCGN